MKKISLALLACTTLSACASHPNSLQATYVSPTKYEAYDCAQLKDEALGTEERMAVLYENLRKTANRDNAQAAGAVLLWPFLFALEGGDGVEATEYKTLKGNYVALESVSKEKSCGIAFIDPDVAYGKKKDGKAAAKPQEAVVKEPADVSAPAEAEVAVKSR